MSTPQPVPAAQNESFDLRSYIDVLGRRWRVIALVAVVALVAALLLSFRQSKQYVASARVLMGTESAAAALGDSAARYSDNLNVDRRLTNSINEFESGVTTDAVEKAYDGPLDPEDVKAAPAEANSDIVKVSLKATDPKAAANLVNRYIDVFIETQRQQSVDDLLKAGDEIQTRIDDLNSRIATIRQPLTEVENQINANPGNLGLITRRADLQEQLSGQLTPLETQSSNYQQQLENLRLSARITETGGPRLLTEAEVPTDPVSPKPIRDGALALVIGLMLGVVVAFVRDNLDERIRSTEDLDRTARGIPPIAVIPEARIPDDPGFVSVRDESQSPVAEAFRSLRTSVKFAGFDQDLRVIQITSAMPGEGKTTAVANLAEALAQGGERVAVVCCDLRRPRLHRAFGKNLSPGFTNVLIGETPLAEALQEVNPRLYLLPAGTPPTNPSELLSSGRAAAVIDAIAAEFDTVIVDCTPVLPVTDALVVSRFVDMTLVVVDTRATKRKALHQTLVRLEQVGAPVRGLVLNGVATAEAYQYGYAYADGYGYSAEPPKGSRKKPSAPERDLQHSGTSQ